MEKWRELLKMSFGHHCSRLLKPTQGPIGLCATAGAKLSGATTIITVDGNAQRLEISRRVGADVTINFREREPVEEIMRLTDGRGVDVAIEALGTQQTFENALRVLRPGWTLSSVGVYSGDLRIPLGPFSGGLGDIKIVTTRCPGGKERLRRMMAVIQSGRVDLRVHFGSNVQRANRRSRRTLEAA